METKQFISYEESVKILSMSLARMQAEMSDTGARITSSIGKLSSLTSALSTFAPPPEFRRMIETIQNSLSSFSVETEAVTRGFQPAISGAEIAAAMQRAIDLSTPYISEDMIVETEGALQGLRSKRLSRGDMISLASLLLSIVFFLISSRPSEQLERIAKQNEIMIEQNEKVIELIQEDKQLIETLNALQDSIDLLTDKANALRNEPVNPLQSDDTEANDYPGDSQNSDAK